MIELQFQTAFIIFWVTSMLLAFVAAGYRARQYWMRRHRTKQERVFAELRQMGYNICDVNSNATRAKLNFVDPFTEQSVYEWVDIIELGQGYGLADPINSERN